MQRLVSVLLLALVLAANARSADAFCGFYVAGAEDELFNNATVVALMRDGTRTVLSMQNGYQGPPEDFAMVVPVPTILQEENVKTLPPSVFDRLDKLAAPRLVEYWEQDPCPPDAGPVPDYAAGAMPRPSGTGSGYGKGSGAGPKVVVEAEFTVGEYDIVILSAKEATALEDWLTGNGYKIPAGAAPHLKPYVTGGMKFFVARVDIEKVQMKNGMAMLSPLRFHYDSETFELPIRLGLINSSGTQDLIVHIVAPGTRYQVANYPNVQIPTNLIVNNQVRERFGEFYAALFDSTLEKNPGAVVTEYAWSAGSCDPCPESPLNDSELHTLGLDVLYDEKSGDAPRMALFRESTPIVSGDADPQMIRRVVRRIISRARRCPAPQDGGELTLDFEITVDGQLENAKVKGVKQAEFRQCIEQNFSSVRVPGTLAGKASVPMRYTSRVAMNRQAGRFVLSRLHARYGIDAVGEDLVFEAAKPLIGGTGGADPEGIVTRTQTSAMNTFQGRYIIRHEWAGEIECAKPRRGVWGGPPPGVDGSQSPRSAQDLALVKRGGVALASMLSDPSAIGLQVNAAEPSPAQDTEGSESAAATGEKKNKRGGCGCRTGGGGEASLGLLIALALLFRRRR